MLLTPEQLHEIRQIIEDHHEAFVVNAMGPEAVSPEVLNRLQEQGLVDVKVESIKDAYVYGQLLAMMQSSEVANMSYEQFKQHVRRNPIPLSEAETHALRMAQQNAGQYCKGLGNRVNVATGAVIFEADAALRSRTEGIIRDATALNIARRESVRKLKSDLGWATKDWARDWDRIAVTEKQTAMQRGVADHYRGRYGGSVLVAKRPMPDACFRAGTPVLTERGEVPIDQVQVGDRVLTHKMRWRRVTRIFQRWYQGKLWGFNSRKPSSTGNHPFLVNLNWRGADSVQCGDYLVGVGVGIAQDNPAKRMESVLFGDISGADLTASMPVSSVQLYRYLQMRDSDIDVEFIDGQFKNRIETRIEQTVTELDSCVSSSGLVFLAGKGLGVKSLGSTSQFSRFTGVIGELLSFLFGHAPQPCPLAIGLGGETQVPFQKTPFDRTGGYPEVSGQGSQGMFCGFPESEQFRFGDEFFPILPLS